MTYKGAFLPESPFVVQRSERSERYGVGACTPERSEGVPNQRPAAEMCEKKKLGRLQKSKVTDLSKRTN